MCTESPERELWVAALERYLDDLKSYQNWLDGSPKIPEDSGEAWGDFQSADKPLLQRLCAVLDYDYEIIAGALK
jgi:hypothetical protein